MSNIEKIKAEIEGLENMDYPCDTSEQATGFYNALDRLSDFIDSLPEEKPSEDLEEAASRGGFDYVDEIEAKAPGLPWNDHDVEFGYRDGFIAGAEWQKSQMMKDAVEGEIGYWNQRGLSIRLDKSLEKLGYGEDTEVKIIIVKQ